MRAGRTIKATATTSILPLRLALFVMGAGALLFEPLHGQDPRSLRSVPGEDSSPVVASHTQAVDVLKVGLEAMGGRTALKSLDTAVVDMDIRRWILGQEPSPRGPRPEPVSGKYRVTTDVNHGRLAVEMFAPNQPESPMARLILGVPDPFTFDAARQVLQEVDQPDEPPFGWFPLYVSFGPARLREAMDRAETLRYLGRAEVDGEEVQGITFVDARGRQRALYFSTSSGLLVTTEEVRDYRQWANVSEAVHFGDYRPVGDLLVPHSVQVTIGGIVASEGIVEGVTVNPGVDHTLFYRPENAEVAPSPIPDGDEAKTRTEEFAPGLFHVLHITPGYNLMYVELEQEVVVIEPLGGSDANRGILREIKSSIPDKPVSGVVVTHHHYDHTDGLFPYLKAGTPIFTTPGNVEFIRAMARAPRGLDEDGPIPSPEFLVVEGRLTVGSGPNRFELIDMGPNPHAEEILVAYFPEQRLMYVPDIYGYVPGYTPAPLLLSFAQRIDELGLEIETFATAHTEPQSWEDYRAMVAQVREATRGGGVR